MGKEILPFKKDMAKQELLNKIKEYERQINNCPDANSAAYLGDKIWELEKEYMEKYE